MKPPLVKLLYIHGLGSNPQIDSVDALRQPNITIVAPYLHYQNKNIFEQLCAMVDAHKPVGIIGHSIGGYMAFYLANKYKLPSLLFNPAFGDEDANEQNISSYATGLPYYNNQIAVIGIKDNVVPPAQQLRWLKPSGAIIYEVDCGHDVPLEIKKAFFNVFLDKKGIQVVDNQISLPNPMDFSKFVEQLRQNDFSTTNYIGHCALIHNAATYLATSQGNYKETPRSKPIKKQESECLRQFASQNNKWVKHPNLNNYISEGAEQKVFFFINYVLKLNDGIFYETWLDYFKSLLLHNYFFQDTAYELIGFVEKENVLYCVVKQNFITQTAPTDLQKVKTFLAENCFENTRNNDYYHPELGLILEDLHDENVLDADGDLFFIDTVFYIKQPEK